jgi:hypothetical protein
MSAQIKDGGAVDVLAEMQADIDALEQRVLAGEFTLSRGYNKVNRLRSIHAAVAELIDKVDSTLALGWSDTAARELRAALARVGGAK